MIFLAAALAAATPPATQPAIAYPKADLSNCSGANDVESMTCRALNSESAGNFADSAVEFEQIAAKLAPTDAVKRDRALSAAGNMWIAAGKPTQAAAALDKALAGKTLSGDQLGMSQLDRARAAADLGDLKTARAMVRAAAVTISADPFLWYFSAALSMRENDLPGARSAVNKALSMAPDSAEVLFEAGHVADASGDDAQARDYWAKAAAADPNGPAGKAARDALAGLEVPLTVTNKVAAHPNGDGDGPADPPQ